MRNPVSWAAGLLVLLGVAQAQSAQQGQGAQAAASVQPEPLGQGFTLLVEDKARLANANSPIYLASSAVNWNAGDPEMRLEQRSDGLWQISLPQPPGGQPIAFKFTRGSWETVELDAELADIPNRTLPSIPAADIREGERPVIRLTVEAWADQRSPAPGAGGADPYRILDVTGNVRRVQVRGGAGAMAGGVRDALVWLPPGYDDPANAGRRYPVLYLLDGQNVFEQAPGTPAEWGADETAQRLVKAGTIEPLVIVAIPHAGSGRVSEYLPVPAVEGVEPRAEEFVAFLEAEVLPRVERAFRVRTDREGRAIGGSSLGAVASLYAAIRRPELFGRVLLESPSPLGGARAAWMSIIEQADVLPERVWIGVGGREAGAGGGAQRIVNATRELARALGSAAEMHVRVDPDAAHDEHAWADRFPAALEHLFGSGAAR